MRKLLVFLPIAAVLAGAFHLPAPTAAAAGPRCDPAVLLSRVKALSDPVLRGRGNGTPEALAAADTIAAWFAAAGLRPHPDLGGWFADFPLAGGEFAGRSGRNVIGLLPGAGPLAGQAVLVGAHYDHLGAVADPDGGDLRIHPGADDNSSGVATLVELAGLFASRAAAGAAPRRALIFAAFAGEDIGLQGSSALVDAPPGGRLPSAMINLDSIGRLREGRLYVGGVGSSPGFGGLVEALGREAGFDLQLGAGGWDASDHVAFIAARVPSLFFFTGPYPEYHTPADRWQEVSAPGMARIADLAAAVIDTLLAAPEPPEFDDEAGSAVPAMRPAGKRRAWLGTIPDFTDEAAGVRLAGVMPDSPAAAAGLRKGDLLVGFAGEDVSDLPGLTALLRAHRAGERVDVVVEREGRRVVFAVTLRNRRK